MPLNHPTATASAPAAGIARQSCAPEPDRIEAAIAALVGTHGESHRQRIDQGVRQVALRWSDSDGDASAFVKFCTDQFVAPAADLDRLLKRLEGALEQIQGHLYELHRNLRRHSDLAGDSFPGVDDMLATFDPAPDLSEELYRQRLAFIALLNFPRPDLGTMLAQGPDWDNAQWASARIAQFFGARIPKELSQRARKTGHACSQWVAKFHIPVGTLVDSTGKRWYQPDRALLTHWLVREEIKGQYGSPQALERQRALASVMSRAIDGTIPAAVMDRTSTADWDCQRNTLGGQPVGDQATVGLVRYEKWLEHFALAREFDRHHPDHPTAISRKFDLAREMSEQSVEALLTFLLEHPIRTELAGSLRKRIGRTLEPFDIYFEDFADPRPSEELNAAVRGRFPDEGAFERALPQVLRDLGFTADDAAFLGTRVRVEIARGSGHAMRPMLPEYSAWLRTSRLKDQLGWDGFDTAMHELGHNLEQLCSTNFVPRPALRGVPNTACTEAFAFLYQSLARRVLGIEAPGGEARAFAIDSVQTMLAACQIAGPSLLELHAWRWLYANPNCTAAALREKVLEVADQLWERFYRRDFGAGHGHLLAAYQHMIGHPLYLADYTLGHVMSHQIRSFMRGRDIAAETKRITSIGRFTPDLWMRRAVGGPVSCDSLVRDCAESLRVLG